MIHTFTLEYKKHSPAFRIGTLKKLYEYQFKCLIVVLKGLNLNNPVRSAGEITKCKPQP